MPTGYTADLYDGKPTTFEQFVLKCSRAMGAAVTQRDDPLDVEIELRTVPDYHRERVESANAALLEATKRDLEEWEMLQEQTLADEARANEESSAKRRAIRERYEEMLSTVKGWVPPTAEHEGLKNFMIDQLEESIEFDCAECGLNVSERVDAREYRATCMVRLANNLASAEKYLREEEERVRSQNAWVQALRDSLKGEPDV